MISVIASLCAAVASLGCLYLLAAIFIVLLRKRKQKASPRPVPVTLLKPLHGAEPRLAECLMSFCAQDYPGPVQIIFGLQDGRDPALAIAKDLKEKFPALDIGITVDASAHGANAKVSNLINMNATAKHDILIAADSDILAPPDYLEQVVALLQKPGAGAVSVLYYRRIDWLYVVAARRSVDQYALSAERHGWNGPRAGEALLRFDDCA